MLKEMHNQRASFSRLLRPNSIAVVGGKEAANVIEQCKLIQFEGKIWPIHPTKTSVHGLPTYRSVNDLPDVPDAAFVAVNRQISIEIIDALRKIGTGGVICYASGFTESDAEGSALQRALLNAAGEMPVIGPNCYGLLNYADGVALWPDQHGGKRLSKGDRGVAIITQSSNIAINMTMQRRALPLAYVITVGNQAQTGISDIARQVLEDPRVSALGLHIEGFDSITGMEDLAVRARQLRKPVIALKIGRSVKAQSAAFTHTASLAGADIVADAFLKRISIARVNSIPSFLETLKLLHVHGVLTGHEISSMSCSGGEACLMSDAAYGRKVNFPDLTTNQKLPVSDALGPMVTISNPLDYHTYIWGNPEKMEAVFSGMMHAGFDLNCLILDYPRPDRCNVDDWEIPTDTFIRAKNKSGAKSAIVATMQENLDEKLAEHLLTHDIAPMLGIDETLDAIEAASAIGQGWALPEPLPVAPINTDAASDNPNPDEAEAKLILTRHAIPTPRGMKISYQRNSAGKSELADIAKNIGFPVVLKIPGIAHKTEMNAVVLNLNDIDQLFSAADRLSHISRDLFIEEMIENPIFELLLGFSTDQQFGLVMTIATGGRMVEIFDDSQTLLLPASKSMIKSALNNLKGKIFFDGYRGSPKADLKVTIQVILAVQKFILEYPHPILELDINPLIIRREGEGVVAADALIKFANSN
jgi:acyl-CoA synthetase (NDP forming)